MLVVIAIIYLSLFVIGAQGYLWLHILLPNDKWVQVQGSVSDVETFDFNRYSSDKGKGLSVTSALIEYQVLGQSYHTRMVLPADSDGQKIEIYVLEHNPKIICNTKWVWVNSSAPFLMVVDLIIIVLDVLWILYKKRNERGVVMVASSETDYDSDSSDV